jgi:hypothetical protein
MPLHTYIDAVTGQTTTVEMTGDELKAYLQSEAEHNELLAKEAIIEERRQALLVKLGITEDEAQLLLGGN